MPDVDYKEFCANLITIETQQDFQVKLMGPFLEMLVSRTTSGLSMDGDENFIAAHPMFLSPTIAI